MEKTTIGVAVVHPKSIANLIKNIENFVEQRQALDEFILFVHQVSATAFDCAKIKQNFRLIYLPRELNIIEVRLAIFEWLKNSDHHAVIFFDADDFYHKERSREVAECFSKGYDFIVNSVSAQDACVEFDIVYYTENYARSLILYNLFGFTNTAIKVDLMRGLNYSFLDVVDWPFFAQCFINSKAPHKLYAPLSFYTGVSRWTGKVNGLDWLASIKSYLVNVGNLILIFRHHYGYVWCCSAGVRALLKVGFSFFLKKQTKFKGWFYDI